MKTEEFARELAELINRHSAENGSNTPDFVLAEFLVQCLAALNNAVSRREAWYGNDWAQEADDESVD